MRGPTDNLTLDRAPRRRRRPRLGITGRIRLIGLGGFTVFMLGAWGYIAFLESHEFVALDAEFEEGISVVVALRDNPEHVEVVQRWLSTNYPRSSFSIFDDLGRLLAQSVPPPEEELLFDYFDWEAAMFLPLSDPQGGRFYARVTHKPPPKYPPWVDRTRIVVPVFLAMVFFLTTMVLAHHIVRPIKRIAGVARQITAGSLHQRTGVERGDEIGELAQAFDAMAHRNAQLLVAQKNLLAQVGHELRTPLARIRVALDIAREHVTPSEATQLADVGQDLDEMARLISDILAVSRIETAGLQGELGATLQYEEIVLDTLAQSVVAKFAEMFPDRRIVPCELEPVELTGDRVLLGRVLWNLLENAHKYSPEDQNIALRAFTDDGRAVWVVEDRGDGIEPDRLARVFEPFFQARTAGVSTTGGFGLGLSLCKRVVDAHGGTISLEPRAGGGLRAQVSLPLEPALEGNS